MYDCVEFDDYPGNIGLVEGKIKCGVFVCTKLFR